MFPRSDVIRRVFLSIPFLLMAWGPATAQTEVTLAPGDTVAFSILGAADLDRQVMINSDGAIYLPLAGKVPAAGLTVDELREKVYAILQDRAFRAGVANGEDVWRRLQEDELYLDVAEFRPVYVSGDVRAPGEVRYRPGMSVRQALAIAGGIGQPLQDNSQDESLRLMTERSLLLGRIEVQTVALERNNAELEAVIAQQSDEDLSESAPAEAAAPQATGEMNQLAERWLAARAELRVLTENGDELVLDRMGNRLDVLEELEGASVESLGFDEEEFDRAQKLFERGVTPAAAVTDARRNLLQSSMRALETSEEALRQKVDIAQYSTQAKASITAEKVRILETITDGVATLRQLERELAALDHRLILLGAVPLGDQKANVEMALFRAGSDTGTAPAMDMAMSPGDVLEVTLSLPDTAPASGRGGVN